MSTSSFEANPSKDGYTYTKKTGLVSGLPSYGVVKPERKIRNNDTEGVWEAIVIGAGYTGLIAARDLVKAGELIHVSRKSTHRTKLNNR